MALSANAIYQLYSDEKFRNSTITIETGVDTGDPNYGPMVLVDDNPAKMAKIASTTGAWLFDFAGVKQPIEIIGLIHHTFVAGCSVVIQGNDSNSWGSPSFSAAFTIPAWFGAATVNSNTLWPQNPWLDLTIQAGYSALGWKFYRLLITGNDQNIQMGKIWGGVTIRRLTRLTPVHVETVDTPIVEVKTAFGVVTEYLRGTNLWGFTAPHRQDDTMDTDSETQWYNTGGRAYPWLFVPKGLVNRCYFVRTLDPKRSVSHVLRNLHDRVFAVEELGRGLRPGV